jgi:homoserine kinase type II
VWVLEKLRANYQREGARVYTGNARGLRRYGRAMLRRTPSVAVLTPIDASDVRALCASYGLAQPRSFTGIAGGSVNSNYTLDAAGGRLFLRLYEERDAEGARRECAMLERLAGKGVPTPAPLRRVDGRHVSLVCGKPAVLFPWRDGHMRCQAAVTPADTARVGEALARVHVAGAGELAEPGRFGVDALGARLDRIAASRDATFAPMVAGLRATLWRVHGARDPGLPRGLTHGDLFRDNVLWADTGEVSALLDFESACEDTFVYDLMVTVLSWCFGDDLDARLASAMREGYERVRPLAEAEKQGLWAEGAFAAMRFTITRITDYALRTGTTGPRVVKDWRRFAKRFEKLEALGVTGTRGLLGL